MYTMGKKQKEQKRRVKVEIEEQQMPKKWKQQFGTEVCYEIPE